MYNPSFILDLKVSRPSAALSDLLDLFYYRLDINLSDERRCSNTARMISDLK